MNLHAVDERGEVGNVGGEGGDGDQAPPDQQIRRSTRITRPVERLNL